MNNDDKLNIKRPKHVWTPLMLSRIHAKTKPENNAKNLFVWTYGLNYCVTMFSYKGGFRALGFRVFIFGLLVCMNTPLREFSVLYSFVLWAEQWLSKRWNMRGTNGSTGSVRSGGIHMWMRARIYWKSMPNL